MQFYPVSRYGTGQPGPYNIIFTKHYILRMDQELILIREDRLIQHELGSAVVD